jgi:long-chain acyl-CoA synthetase
MHKEFDPDEAELTRTRKLRREFMEMRYKPLIEAIYAGQRSLNVEASVTYRDGRKGVVSTDIKIWDL